MAEERPVEHRSEPGLAEQADHLIEPDAVAHLHIEPGKQSRIGVDPHDSALHGPAGPRAPIPADQACPPDLLADRAIAFEELADLLPPLPVAPDVHHAVGLLRRPGRAPRRCCFAGRCIRLGDRTGIVAVEQERADIRTERSERWLQDGAGDRPDGVLPLPPRMAVELLQVVEVVLQPDRVVEPAPEIHHHAPFAGNAVEQPSKVGHVRKVRRHLDDEQGEVHSAQVGRERQRGQLRMRRAIDGNLVPERPTGRDILVDGGHAPRPRVDRNDEQEFHRASAPGAAVVGWAPNSLRAQLTVSASPLSKVVRGCQPRTDCAWRMSACTVRCSPGRVGARITL